MHNRLPTDIQNYIHISKYSRFSHELGRRENWEETITRYIDYVDDTVLSKMEDAEEREAIKKELFDTIIDQKSMPSMRGLMTAGRALERDHAAIYNCSYLPIDSVKAFDEAMYLLACGTGVGFSVERQYVNQLPEIPEEMHESDTTIIFRDSKIGWAKGFREFISLLYSGQVPKYDTSKIRERGAILKTFGGRASGPEPLIDLLEFTKQVFLKAVGRKLNSLEAHDIMCKVGDCIVSGGVRRSALISLSNLSDERMRGAKSGQWWENNEHRSLANNSVAYTEIPEVGQYMDEWKSLYDSKSGERGIIYRKALNDTVVRSNEFRDELKQDLLAIGGSMIDVAQSIRARKEGFDWGVNPCAEIILRPYEFCNLSEVIVRPGLSLKDLKDRVRTATILGTIQSSFTEFRYINSKWKKNVEEERLLGVSLTGIMSHEVLNGSKGKEKLREWLREMRREAIITNAVWAKKLGIPSSVAITCVKPSGTASLLNGTPAGIHTDWSDFYIKRFREDKTSPISKMFRAQGVPVEDDVMKKDYVDVFSFPVKAPKGVKTRKDFSAIEMLELWKDYQLHWCDHKPSITVNVRESEWISVGAWVWENFKYMSGVSFLPFSEHTYRQAPFEEIDESRYEALVAEMPKIEWADLPLYESEDLTSGSQELACVAGGCVI